MAFVTRTYLTDDLDGTEGDVSTVRIALDNVSYDIDLSADHRARLRDTLVRFVAVAIDLTNKPAARRVRTSGPAGTRPDKEQTQAIRAWARANGYQLPHRGRVPALVRAAFSAAHEKA